MDKNSNAKQPVKKTQMGSEKLKKSASIKKKKKSKKFLKSDQSPDNLEVEGVGKFDQTGADSDSSAAQPLSSGSPTVSHALSTAPVSRHDSPTATNKNSATDTETNNALRSVKPKSAPKSFLDNSILPPPLKHTQSTTSVLSLTSNKGLGSNKKISVSFSSFDEIQSISSNLGAMSVKSKNGSTKAKTKSSSKSSSIGAIVKKDKPTKTDPIKSSINKAAEEAAKKRSEESLRWEFELQDEEKEKERIREYKINRRKRYLAAAQKKGLGWVVNYGMNGSPIIEDAIPEISKEPKHTTISDFSPVRNIMASQGNTSMSLGGEIVV